MKTKLILLLALILLLSSCAPTDSFVSVAEETAARPADQDAKWHLYINTSEKKIHYEPDCRYLKRTKEENITALASTSENLQTLLEMDYIPCNNCVFSDYLK